MWEVGVVGGEGRGGMEGEMGGGGDPNTFIDSKVDAMPV